MFSIGDFARLGLVSVRMLRHYDAIGLLRPARVDPVSGYRSYQAAQLARLNRIVALKDLGFTLDQVSRILDDKVSAEELHGMVRLRRAQLEAQISADLQRLQGVEARLRMIEEEGAMQPLEVIVKRVERVRVVELSGQAAGYEPADITPVIQPLFEQLWERAQATGLTPVGACLAYYLDAADGAVSVHAAMPIAGDGEGAGGLDVVDLPELKQAATLIHRGPMDGVGASFQALATWVEDNGFRALGLAREVYLDCPDEVADWVTELQMEIAPA
ncbi:MerR family transcriptional regulator [Nonomuraea sp. NPDC050328]|uniref:MerR family transcriptional regulator n=1 Tax=Nonomuraea sp. NPDC050328 TaxID=3364361 RepID=UPI003789D7E0